MCHSDEKKEPPKSSEEREITMTIESEHPYSDAKMRTYKCEFPEGVSFVVIEFDSQCETTQDEDYVEVCLILKPMREVQSGNVKTQNRF